MMTGLPRSDDPPELASSSSASTSAALADIAPFGEPVSPLTVPRRPSLAERRQASVSSAYTGIDPLDSSASAQFGLTTNLSHSPTFDGPSSAPPTPSVVSITHPSQFIHTHHPRRGSLTPLGLNVISPVPPPPLQHALETASLALAAAQQQQSSSPMRSVGFVAQGGEFTSEPSRRDSVATVASNASSNLTATRPSPNNANNLRRLSLTPSISALPIASSSTGASSSNNTAPNTMSNFNPAKRRSSLTLSNPTLAAPSPTRTLVSGRLNAPLPPRESRTIDTLPSQQPRRSSALAALADGRRGSLPHLYYGAWTGPQPTPFNPTLASTRGSVDDTAVIDQTFKFGSLPDEGPIASAASSLQRIHAMSLRDKSAFEQAEEAEAERQRRAFLAATFGEDSRRARARLSLGGGNSTAGPASPASTRRTSLLIWERIQKPQDGQSIINFDDTSLGRRPSLPVNIPPRGAVLEPERDPAASVTDPTSWEGTDEHEDDDHLATPQRPLPPLLPLSDPVPRLLQTTLALHRASHLLNSRNLESEPLPAPLPPSLHPPAPVDLSEFDIDFILAGSKPNLGRNGSGSTKSRGSNSFEGQERGTARPSDEVEDSFAKFVGAFDDEYGGRRGEWTFRACPLPRPPPPEVNPIFPVDHHPDEVDPLDPAVLVPRAAWDAPGAGRFEIYPNGDIRAVESGHIWRIRQMSSREYDLEQQTKGQLILPTDPVPDGAHQPLILTPYIGYTLTGKMVHTENGGVKLPFTVQRELASRREKRVSHRFAAATRNRASVSEPLVMASYNELNKREHDERARFGSHDSDATAIPHGQRVSHPTVMARRPTTPTPPSGSPPKGKEDKPKREHRRSRQKDVDEEKTKKSSSFGGALKRSMNKVLQGYEERKERGSHMWGANGHSSNHTNSSHSSGTFKASPMRHASDRSDSASASSQQSSRYNADGTVDPYGDEWPGDEAMFGSLGLGIEDEQNGGLPWKEGKAWEGVPDEALAMVIPIESEITEPHKSRPSSVAQPFINPFFIDGPRQALLVWFTPFNSGGDTRFGSNSTLFKIQEAPHHEQEEHHVASSLGRLPKLLRPRGSKMDSPRSTGSPRGIGGSRHMAHPLPVTTTPPNELHDLSPIIGKARGESANLRPLPFKSFRVVAKVVQVEDLKSSPEVPVIALEQWAEQVRTGKPAGLATPPLDGATKMEDPASSSSGSSPDSALNAAVEANISSGRAFPTVIAVCHSHNQGVEFVLEGLDRLGLCKGESAWGPTGYEEWRGTGLSDNGRQLIDLLWASCSAIMGL